MSSTGDRLDGIEGEDFYAVLNVPKDASAEDIKGAYKRMCVLYHPDKHTDPELQRLARDTFPKIQKAYSVLSDEQKRAIYDVYGEKGLEAGFDLAPYYNTAAELKAEYELQRRRAEEERLLAQAHPTGKMSVTLDASTWFREDQEDYSEFEDEKSWIAQLGEIQVASMSLQQSVETSVSDKDTLTLSGAMLSRGGNGGGSLSGVWARNWGVCTSELGYGFGAAQFAHAKVSKNIEQGCHVFCEVTAQEVKQGLMVSLGAGAMQSLGQHTQGLLRWSAGMESLMATSLHYNTDVTNASVTFQLGLPNTFLGLQYSRKLTDTLRTRLGLKLGLVGVSFNYGVDRDIGEKRTIGVALHASMEKGVEVRWRYQRASQTYTLPIMLSDEMAFQPILYGTLIPVFVVAVVNHLVIAPYLKGEELKKVKEQRKRFAALIAKRRQEAQSAVRLMQETVERKIKAEESVGGLIIVQAWYGKLVKAGDADSDAPLIDVRIALQCLVKDSQLRLQGISKSNLVGFYDPCIDEQKSLKIVYKFKGQMHEVTIDDKEELKIPLKKHLIQ